MPVVKMELACGKSIDQHQGKKKKKVEGTGEGTTGRMAELMRQELAHTHDRMDERRGQQEIADAEESREGSAATRGSRR